MSTRQGTGSPGFRSAAVRRTRYRVAQDRVERLELLPRHMPGTRGGTDLPGAVDLQLGGDQGDIGVAGSHAPPLVEPSGVVQSEFGETRAVLVSSVPVPVDARPRQQLRRRLPDSRPRPRTARLADRHSVRPLQSPRPAAIRRLWPPSAAAFWAA